MRPTAGWLRGLVVLLILFAAGCAVPQYDDTANTQLTALQKEVDSQIVTFISLARQGGPDALKKGSYAQNIDWYNKVDTDTTSLELRMEAVLDPSTKNLPTFFDNLRQQFANLRKTHEAKGNLPEPVWVVTRNQLNVQFAALITYELSLKGTGASAGSTTSTATTGAAAKAAAPP